MNREQLKAKFAKRVETVKLENYDVEVTIRPLSALERAQAIDKHKAALADAEGSETRIEKLLRDVECFVVAKALIDANGNRIYQDTELDTIASDFPCDALDYLSKKVMVVSGIEKEVDEAVKNSTPTPSESSN